VRSSHGQSDEIEQVVREMVVRRDQLRDQTALRKLRLDDALESQQFFIQCHELMSWITEKDLMVSQKIHIDNDFIQSLLKRIESLELELATHTHQVNDLQAQADAFVKRGHFDAVEISNQMETIASAFARLEQKVLTQKDQLSINYKVYQFNRDSEEMEDLINSRLTMASSEDYGKDLDDVERLIHKFEGFFDNLMQQREKLNDFNALSSELEEIVQDYEIGARNKEVNDAWNDLMELAVARKEALVGARMVHAFDKRIDEMLEWILEKEALLSVDVNCPDNESIQDHKQRQDGLKQDLKAISEQVVSINRDADSLTEAYPDAVDHILAKRREMLRAVDKLDGMVKARDTQLEQNEQLLEYLATFRELMAWATEFLARMSAPELSENLQDAVTVHSRHRILHEEMEAHRDLDAFAKTGNALIRNGHFMADDIADKIAVLDSRRKTLVDCWALRNRIYEQHMDYLKWLKDIVELEGWLRLREDEVYSTDYGNSFDELDKLMLKQLEMEEALFNKETKMDGIKRITLIETEFKALKEKEEEARRADEQRLEAERIEAIKKKEAARKSRERRREDERRRTQEIVLPPNHNFQANKDGNSLQASTGNGTDADGDKMMIPRFNTRRSLRQPAKWKYDPKEMPPVTVAGFLERKQQVQSGGKRSTIRSWKTYYTVLSGQLLCFFKDEQDFKESKAASSPILIHNASVQMAKDYTKKKHVFRLITPDSSEFLFDSYTEDNQTNWMDKLTLSSTLAPSESVRQSMQNDHLVPPQPAPPAPPAAAEPEPLYENLQQQHSPTGYGGGAGGVHPPKASPDSKSTVSDSYNSDSLDSRENKRSKLTKFWGRKHKVQT